MEFFIFLTEVIKAVAWPVAAVVMLRMLRKPISDLIPLLKSIKYKGMEANFGRELDAIEKNPKDTSPPEVKISTVESAKVEQPVPAINSKKYRELMAVSPAAAIMEAWYDFEGIISAAAQLVGYGIPHDGPTSQIIDGFAKARIIGSSQAETLHELRRLRNMAAHDKFRAVTDDDALRYIYLIEQWMHFFDILPKGYQPPPA